MALLPLPGPWQAHIRNASVDRGCLYSFGTIKTPSLPPLLSLFLTLSFSLSLSLYLSLSLSLSLVLTLSLPVNVSV